LGAQAAAATHLASLELWRLAVKYVDGLDASLHHTDGPRQHALYVAAGNQVGSSNSSIIFDVHGTGAFVFFYNRPRAIHLPHLVTSPASLVSMAAGIVPSPLVRTATCRMRAPTLWNKCS